MLNNSRLDLYLRLVQILYIINKFNTELYTLFLTHSSRSNFIPRAAFHEKRIVSSLSATLFCQRRLDLGCQLQFLKLLKILLTTCLVGKTLWISSATLHFGLETWNFKIFWKFTFWGGWSTNSVCCFVVCHIIIIVLWIYSLNLEVSSWCLISHVGANWAFWQTFYKCLISRN